uniref:non-specific serine/threonine protein kinase n=1 Tax=Latimeria chalumnae TaxID=7897 RepID=H3AV73_LATCH
MADGEKLEDNLKKLIVRLKNVQEGKEVDTVVQILEDLLALTFVDFASELFEDKNTQMPLLVVLDSYITVPVIQQQIGWSLLCRLIEIHPTIVDNLAGPQDVGKDWDVLGVHQQILKMLSTYNAKDELMTVGLQALAGLLKSDKIALLLLEEEAADIFFLVIEAMRIFSANDIQKFGCQALQILLQKVPDEQLIEFVESKDHTVILNALKQFEDNEEIVLNALCALLPLAGPSSNVEVLMSGSEKCYNLVVNAMMKFPDSEKVQEIGCCIFQKFTVGNFYNILVLNGAQEVLVKAVMRDPANAKLQKAALSSLALLTEAIVLNKDLEERKDEDDLCWLEASCKALELHRVNVDVQEAACWALNNLLIYQHDLPEKIGDEDKEDLVHRHVMTAMLLHSSSKEVFQAAASALATLSEQSVVIRKLLLAKGIHINTLDIMKKHLNSSDVAESACKLLNRLFQGSILNLDVMTLALSGIISAMRKHESVSSVQLEALRVILHFTHTGLTRNTLNDVQNMIFLQIIKNQCLLEGAHVLVLEALNKFIGNPAIQKCGLKILHSVAECSGAIGLLTQQGASDTVLHSLQMYPDNQEIQLIGLSLLRCLISKKNLSAASLYLLATVFVAALRRFENVVEIQIQGLCAALTLLELSQNAANVLEQESFETILFHQMTIWFTEKRDQQFQSLCCRCLAKMSDDNEIKHKMLEKACVENNVIMAECLLLLGADVNKKTKTNSLIYQVCEKGNNPCLVEVVLNGAREQDVRKALSISIKRGDSRIINLLLKKLGLDRTNNSICLGGFRLGKIEPSWLSPLFPENKSPNLRRQTSAGGTLARMVLRYQMKQSSDVRCSDDEEPAVRSGDWIILPDPHLDSGFYISEDNDSDGSESSVFGRRISNSIPVSEPHRDSGKRENIFAKQRSHNPLNPDGDAEPVVRQQRNLFQSSSSIPRSPILPSLSKRSESYSSLSFEREFIKSLDLSANELENVDSISQTCCLTDHLEHLQKLELHQNNLTEFSQHLCETLKCLAYLDLHSNKFTTFPSCLLEMHCIAYLDVSRNDIGPSLTLDLRIRCPTLKQFSISYNQLVVFPESLVSAANKLEELHLEGNKISEINYLLCLTELRLLSLNNNNISAISENFLINCPKMETLTASTNFLSALPILPSKITTLKLSHNKFTKISEAILCLPHLRTLDLSNNEIGELPGPVHWESLNLRELILNCNKISVLDLSKEAYKWSRLEKLHLSNNKLKEIPPQIGQLANITSLDVSYNPDLRSFPNEIGKLIKVWDLPLDGLHLDLDLKHIGSKTKDIIRFLQQRLKKSVPYYRMKLMIVGNAGSGKTTLLQHLMRCKHSDVREKATVGIDVKDWVIPVKVKVKKELILNVWDFAGQEEFYSTHPHFMTQRALYLVVYDLSKGATEVDAIKPWLFNIKARASSSPVILVGTHLDVSDEKQRKACSIKITKELFHQRGFPTIRDFHCVNATEESDSLGKLRKTIVMESLNFKIRDQPVMGQLIPDSYLELEKRILKERKNVPTEFPVVSHHRLLELVQLSQLELDENELPHAVHFLNESGVLLHFEDPALQLRDLYFVEPQWLCKMMAQILTMKLRGFQKYPKGIIQRSDVEKFLSQKSVFPKNYMCQYFKLLEKFQIALPLGEEQLLVPSSLSDQRPVIDLPYCENSEITVRLYEMPYFPMGFWSRLINRLLEISPYMLSGRATERAVRPNRIYWRQGIYLNWSPEAYCLVESAVLDNKTESYLKITVPCRRKGFILLGQVVDHIDSLMEEWFPGLLETDVCGEGETLLKKWALYSFEDGQDYEKILLDELLQKAKEGDVLVNPNDARLRIPIAQIAPDLVLADLPRNIMLNNDELEIDQTPEFLLVDNTFLSLQKAIYKTVLFFNKRISLLFVVQELAVLSHLHHPSLISLLAAGVRPRMLVMELAPKGSLDHFLQHDKVNITRTLQHRIALHVADGLRYLHSSMIIYRDLKPHNVLLFTLYPNSAIIAKIADYGIAQYCCRMGIKTSEGTPGFRAPEVARGNVIYNQQADIYSFGLLLYDILTAGDRILAGIKYPNEFDEMAIQGKLPDPVKEYHCSPWPGVQSLIKDCLKENPEERPTSAQVFVFLNSAELLCLMKEVLLPTSWAAECMVATHYTSKKPGIWIGNGKRDVAQLTFLHTDTGGHSIEDIGESRILCLVLVSLPDEKENWILAGTQSGSLLVINSEDMKNNHQLKRMSDSVTCLFCPSHSRHSKERKFVLVGTADGKLAIFEDTAIKCKDAEPIKIVSIGNISTPLMCLNESLYSSEKDTIWAGCGTNIISFSSDFSIQKSIDTKNRQLFLQKSFPNSNIITMAIDKYIYFAKKDSHFVEIWDKKAEKPCELLDCAHFLKIKAAKLNERKVNEVFHSARVKVLYLQKNTALWVGTGGGHVLLIDLSKCWPIRIISQLCDSIRSMVTTQVEKGSPKNVMLILGNTYKSSHDTQQPKEVQSHLFVWDINLPHEIQNLEKHIELRQEMADKMKSCSFE